MTSQDPPASDSPPQPVPPPDDKDEKLWATLCHLSSFAGYFTGIGHVIGPLIVWLIKKDQYPLVDDQGKEVLNFQLSMTIYYVVAAILFCVYVGLLVFPALVVFAIVVTILGAVKASTGEAYRYPLCIRFLK
jgi:uncharacterized Tic20 family protein